MNQPPKGYKKRPVELSVIALVFALVPAINLVGWMISYNLSGLPFSLTQILDFNLFTFQFGIWGQIHMFALLSIWILFWITAVGVYLVRPWGFVLSVVTAALNWVFSLMVFKLATVPGPMSPPLGLDFLQPTALTNLVFFIPVLVILQRDLLAPFFNPKLKWWEQHKRIKASLKIEADIQGTKLEFKTFDVSKVGIFLATDKEDTMKIGDTFTATIHLEDLHETIVVDCKVVWLNPGNTDYPKGIGCGFLNLTGESAKKLGSYLAARRSEEVLHHRNA